MSLALTVRAGDSRALATRQAVLASVQAGIDWNRPESRLLYVMRQVSYATSRPKCYD
jgi:hypothetical protein